MNGLEALEARLRQDLEWLELPSKPWVPERIAPDGRAIADVAIIGAGMAGLAAAAALWLDGIDRLRVLDRAPQGQEGPWVTFARMETLRSPKGLAGPALGLPALTFRAFFEAQHGRDAWEALGKIPRVMWMDYLNWYRRVMAVPVENGADVALIRPREDGLIALEMRDGPEVLCRRLVLASGRDGLGGEFVPDMARGVDRRFWAHSRDEIDFAALRGKRVGVVGAGASAMDNAATALEEGAASLDLFVRRPALPRINKFTGIGSQGVVHGFAGLPDEWKWRFMHYAGAAQTPPPRDSTLRVSRHPHARLHLSSPVTGVREEGGALVVATPRGEVTVDFLIFATGFKVALDERPELALIAPHIRLWRDRFTPERGQESEELSYSPDLAPDFSFQEKVLGECPALARIHAFNYPATLSHGKLTGDIPAISAGARRLARGIARSLFVEDRETHFERLVAFDTPELLGDEWSERGQEGE
ncbi:NAD(P)-binding domain-containing protein [Roseomonas xinghualingensis]|uniref:NAD(P)-binding domain-containing protein n=1 Tax=Roseomonas xinghualingensis TaxID=2986475 RepID=UPI0021F0C328|nr:NAD(P)/FAD-dependent oxidoreductase [Roseomonas sp. SXEYE001]MCV4207064.1 NAD(P)/FAD-dependent oxidoreductase [Roseomonas sp. SXEYE001]